MIVRLCVERVGTESTEAKRYPYQFDQDEILIGRSRGVDVQLPDAAISLVHARLRRKKNVLWVEDAGSTNGCVLDGHRLAQGCPMAMEQNSRLVIGPYELSLCSPQVVDELTGAGQTAFYARQMVLEVMGLLGEKAGQPVLEVIAGPQRGTRIELPRQIDAVVVGRAGDCPLCLTDADVSRRHLEFSYAGSELRVRDLGSKNGLIVNGKSIAGVHRVRHGDRFFLGQTVLRFEDPSAAYLAELEQAEAPAAPGAEAAPPSDAAAARRTPPPSPPILVPSATKQRRLLRRVEWIFWAGTGLLVVLALAATIYLLL